MLSILGGKGRVGREWLAMEFPERSVTSRSNAVG